MKIHASCYTEKSRGAVPAINNITPSYLADVSLHYQHAQKLSLDNDSGCGERQRFKEPYWQRDELHSLRPAQRRWRHSFYLFPLRAFPTCNLWVNSDLLPDLESDTLIDRQHNCHCVFFNTFLHLAAVRVKLHSGNSPIKARGGEFL